MDCSRRGVVHREVLDWVLLPKFLGTGVGVASLCQSPLPSLKCARILLFFKFLRDKLTSFF